MKLELLAQWSALAFLPDDLKERLVEAPEKRDKHQKLYQSVQSLSASDALKLFSDKIVSDEKTQHAQDSIRWVSSPQQSSEPVQIDDFVGELRELLGESPAIEVRLDAPASSTPWVVRTHKTCYIYGLPWSCDYTMVVTSSVMEAEAITVNHPSDVARYACKIMSSCPRLGE